MKRVFVLCFFGAVLGAAFLGTAFLVVDGLGRAMAAPRRYGDPIGGWADGVVCVLLLMAMSGLGCFAGGVIGVTVAAKFQWSLPKDHLLLHQLG